MMSDNKVLGMMREAQVSLTSGIDMWHNKFGKKHLEEFKKDMTFILREVDERLAQEVE